MLVIQKWFMGFIFQEKNYYNRPGGNPSRKYFALVIQFSENSGIIAKTEPPTQTEKILSLGAMILIV
jgi:hypothetical protein